MTRREHDLTQLANGLDTGWWDEHGVPAPWPDDFFDPDTDWRPTGHDNPPTLATNEPPF